MPTLDWKEVSPGEQFAGQTARWVARHGTIELAVWHATTDDQWGWSISEDIATGEQTETSAASSQAEAQDAAEARARDRRLIP